MVDAFEIVLSDSFGNRLTLTTVDEIRSFLVREEETWRWLDEAPHTYVRLNSTPSQHLRTARSWIANLESGAWQPNEYSNHLNQLYSSSPQGLLLSDFEPGANVVLIRDEFDAAMGEMAFGLLTGQFRPDIREDLRAFRVWQMVASPTLISHEAWASEHRRKLGAMRAAVARELSAVRANEVQRVADDAQFYATHRKFYREVAARAARLGSRRASRIAERANTAVASIEATEAAYSLQMGLEAPVRYWRAKQRAHEGAATNWGVALLIYALAAILGSCLAVPAIWEALPANESLTGRHFILVAAIGAALTTLFWIARVLVRIYLGERHLATDAEERRVMTQAYLALMKGDAASNEERAIILSALFRTAQDGIVREEGVGDVGLPAIIARLLDNRR